MSLSCDRSWRVRWSFSNGLHEICRGVGEEITNSSLVNVFQTLLEDMEPEVCACVTVYFDILRGTISSPVYYKRHFEHTRYNMFIVYK